MSQITKLIVITTLIFFASMCLGMLFLGSNRQNNNELMPIENIQSDLIMVYPEQLGEKE